MITALENLLNENRKALQGLHAIVGMDFEKPFQIISDTGSFTYNSVLNILGKPDLDKEDVFVIYQSSKSWNKRKTYLAHVIKYGKFETLREDIEGYQTAYGWRWFSEVFTKGDFEKIRKDKEKRYWIISQERKYIIPKKQNEVDYSERMRFKVEFGKVQYAMPYNKNGDWYYNNVIHRDFYGRYYPYTNIDKSGYFNTNNYYSRADALRAERSAMEAAKFDNTEKLKEYTDRINHLNEAMQIILAGKFLDINYRKVIDIMNYLRWIKGEYKVLMENNFKSVSCIEGTLKYLDDKISDAEKCLNEEAQHG